jgi:hypothetical protein
MRGDAGDKRDGFKISRGKTKKPKKKINKAKTGLAAALVVWSERSLWIGS